MTTIPSETADEILRGHEIAPPATGEHPRRHQHLGAGVELALGGHKDVQGAKTLTLTIGNLSQSRSCPLSETQAQDMVERLRERHAIPSRHAEENTLRNLLLRCSRMYAESEIDSFIMKPVHLHEGGYRIDAVRMFSARSVKVVPRLERHAHDSHAAAFDNRNR